MPVRLLHGSEEPLLGSALFQGPVPADDHVLECVQGGGHFLPEERPQLVADRILGR